MYLHQGIILYDDTDLFTESECKIIQEVKYISHLFYDRFCTEFGLKNPNRLLVTLCDAYDERIWGSHMATKTGVEVVAFSWAGLLVDPSHVYDVTIPHEVAHALQFQVFGKCEGHGTEWKEIMDYFGVPAETRYTSTYEVDHKMLELETKAQMEYNRRVEILSPI